MRKRKRAPGLGEFLSLFTGVQGVPNWAVPLSILGTLLLGLLINDLFAMTGTTKILGISTRAWVYLGILVVAILIYLGLTFIPRRPWKIQMEDQEPVGKGGLILQISTLSFRGPPPVEAQAVISKIRQTPVSDLSIDDFNLLKDSNLYPAFSAAEYHIKQKTLIHCWMITTMDTDQENGSHDIPPLLEKWLQVAYPHAEVRFDYGEDLQVKPRDYAGLWEKVDNLFNKSSLKDEYIIADITSGTKPMSIGIALACLPTGRTMQYMTTNSDWRGNPIPKGEMHPILIDIDPYLEGTSD